MQTRVNRRKFIVSATCSICGSVILPSCAQVPLTNRNQLNLYDSNLPIVIFQGSVAGIPIPKVYANEKSLNQEIDKVYNKFISQAKNDKILVDNTAESKKIKEQPNTLITDTTMRDAHQSLLATRMRTHDIINIAAIIVPV